MILKNALKGFIFCSFLSLAAPVALQAQTKSVASAKKNAPSKKYITLSGKVNFLVPEADIKRAGYNYNKVYVGQGISRSYVAIDSTTIKPDGTYSIKIDATKPDFYRIDFAKWDRVEIYADADAEVNVRGYDTSKYKMKNNPYIHIKSISVNNKILNLLNNDDYWGYQDMIASSQESYFAGKIKEQDSTWLTFVKKKQEEDRVKQTANMGIMEIVLEDYKDYPAVIKAIQRLRWKQDTTKAMSMLNHLIKLYPNFEDAKQMKKDIVNYLVRSSMLENGKAAPVLNYPDPKGNNISLASYKGKYVLIDFWASWCGPCRQAVPKVKKQYAMYKDKGFDVFAVSIDHDKKAWHKAMDEEDMPWKQVLSPNIDKTMSDYMFSGIPTLYLIDPQGNIVDKYTGYSEELEMKLEQIFAGK